ncbi:unnamed protein product [Caenorhabditis nigoni]
MQMLTDTNSKAASGIALIARKMVVVGFLSDVPPPMNMQNQYPVRPFLRHFFYADRSLIMVKNDAEGGFGQDGASRIDLIIIFGCVSFCFCFFSLFSFTSSESANDDDIGAYKWGTWPMRKVLMSLIKDPQ